MTAVGTIGTLLQAWLASAMPLIEIIGQTISPAFIDSHRPVFSGRTFGHFTLVQRSPLVIGGRQISCLSGCVDKLNTSHKVVSKSSSKWRIVCPRCKWSTSYTVPKDTGVEDQDRGKVLDIPHQAAYIRTPYPVEKKTLIWRPPGNKDKLLQPPSSGVTRVHSEGSLRNTTKRIHPPSPPQGSSAGGDRVAKEGGLSKRRKVQHREYSKLSFLTRTLH